MNYYCRLKIILSVYNTSMKSCKRLINKNLFTPFHLSNADYIKAIYRLKVTVT